MEGNIAVEAVIEAFSIVRSTMYDRLNHKVTKHRSVCRMVDDYCLVQ
jgi:hypothetical protein